MENWTSEHTYPDHDYEDDAQSQLSMEEEQHIRRSIKLIFCIAYGILFILGTIGNGFVIIMIGNVMSVISKNQMKTMRKISVSSTKHVFIYVLALSIVDFLVILHLPLLICEMIEGEWIFGQLMCKLYWFGESVNKLLSSFLMTVLSWDRYLAVCSPIKCFRMRTNSVAVTVVLSISVLATLLLYPVLKESSVVQVNKMTGLRLIDDSYELRATDEIGLTVHKCIFDTPTSFFMLYTFMVGYIVPALLIIFFYLKVILRLRSNALSVRKYSDTQTSQISNARFYKVTKRIIAVILFYFFCWTPYWMLNIMSQFGVIVVSWSTLALSSVFFSAHLLVCFNSAANPVLYALINRELRQQHVQALQKRRQSLHTATHNALDFVEKHSHRMLFCTTSSINGISTGTRKWSRPFLIPSFYDSSRLHAASSSSPMSSSANKNRLRSVSSADSQFHLFGNAGKAIINEKQRQEARSSSFSHNPFPNEIAPERKSNTYLNCDGHYPDTFSPCLTPSLTPTAKPQAFFRFHSVLSLLNYSKCNNNSDAVIPVVPLNAKDSIDSTSPAPRQKGSVRFAKVTKKSSDGVESSPFDKLSQNFDFFL